MQLKNLFIASAALLAFVACSSDDGRQETAATADGRIPIQLGYGLNVTRSATDLQDDAFDQSTVVDIKIEATDNKEKYDLLQYQVTDLSGSLAPVKKVDPYYPTNGSTVDIYGIYPSGYLDAGSFTVQTTQLSDAQYQASDLIYGKVTAQAATQDKVTIPFRHLLSKVVVNLSAAGDEDIDQSEVRLLNVATKIDMPSRGTLAEEADDSSRTGILMSTDGSISSATIIVPQEVPSGVLIEVKLTNHDVVNYKTTQTTIFESGKKYTYNITVVESGLEVKTKVEDWLTTDDQKQNTKL